MKTTYDKKIYANLGLLELINNTHVVQNKIMRDWNLMSNDIHGIGLTLMNRDNFFIPVLENGGWRDRLHFYYEEKKIRKKIITGEQLGDRIVNPNSSKKQSALILLGKIEGNPDNYYEKIAIECRDTWKNHDIGELLDREDDNLKRMFEHFKLNKDFEDNNSEIGVYCAIIGKTNLTTANQKYGKQWIHHEEDRTQTIAQTLKQYLCGSMITTRDPRQIISIMMRSRKEFKHANIKYPHLVMKIMPNFWELLDQ